MLFANNAIRQHCNCDPSITGGLDYTALVTIVKINPGDRECVSIPIIDDSLQENTEEFAVILNINDVSVKRSIPFTRVKIMDGRFF